MCQAFSFLFLFFYFRRTSLYPFFSFFLFLSVRMSVYDTMIAMNEENSDNGNSILKRYQKRLPGVAVFLTVMVMNKIRTIISRTILPDNRQCFKI